VTRKRLFYYPTFRIYERGLASFVLGCYVFLMYERGRHSIILMEHYAAAHPDELLMTPIVMY